MLIYGYGGEIFNIFDIIDFGIFGICEEFICEWCKFSDESKLIIDDLVVFGSYLCDFNIMICEQGGGFLFNCIVVDVFYDEEVVVVDEQLVCSFVFKVLLGFFIEWGQVVCEFDMMVCYMMGVVKVCYVVVYVRILLEVWMLIIFGGWYCDVYDIWFEELKFYNLMLYMGSEMVCEKDCVKYVFMVGEIDCIIMSL